MSTITPTTVEELLDYWPGNIPFKGSLVSDDGCMCAQGQALHFLGKYSASDLRNIEQATADKKVAELFGISRAHSVLLRIVNDGQDGAPTSVIRNPEQVLGNQAQVVLAYWRHLDRMKAKDWAAARAAALASRASNEIQGAAALAAARAAALAAARAAAEASNQIQGAATWVATWVAAGAAARAAAEASEGASEGAAEGAAAEAAARASNEIQGAAMLRANGRAFFFLPLFGFADPESVVIAADN